MICQETLRSVQRLSGAESRRDRARQLAHHLGADDLVLFVPDSEIGVLLPAPGLHQTLPEGRRWHEFVQRCLECGEQAAVLPYPDGERWQQVCGVATSDGSVLALLGGAPDRERVESARTLLPLLTPLMQYERSHAAAAQQFRLASDNAARATLLAETLDRARGELQLALTASEVLAAARDEALAQAEAERHRLAESETLKTSILNTALDSIITMDASGTVLEFNPAAERTFGYARAEAVGQELADLIVPPGLRAQHRGGLARYLRTGESRLLGRRIEVRGMRRDGSEFPMEMAITRISTDGPPIFTGYLRDISERKHAEETLEFQARHDVLTQLPNRQLLHDRLELALQQPNRGLALLLLDLDRFKDVNDTFGHQVGDQLLCAVSHRLRSAVRQSDTVARLGGDEFAVVLPGSDAEGAQRVADGIRDALNAPVALEGRLLQVGASVGIALYPDHGEDGPSLLRSADVAMYVAKRNKLGSAVYAASQDRYTPDRVALMADLRTAIVSGGMELYFQPIVAMRRTAAEGSGLRVEALARWKHSTHGWVAPDVFVPLAEQMGMVTALTRWVLTSAISRCARWQNEWVDVGVAVNMSMWDLLDPELPRYVMALLETHGLSPECLHLELTESVIMADTGRTLDVLTRLADHGVHVSIDDFGTGYSSLSYLKRLPVDTLKIDRSFVCEMVHDRADESIVLSTVTLAHALGLEVVAEGVEDARTWAHLQTMGCDWAQGYHVGHPMDAQSLETWMRSARGSVAG